MTELTDVYSRIDEGFDDALDDLAALVRIAGVSAEPTGELARCAEAVRQCMIRSGLDARLIDGYGPSAVYGERIVDPGRPTVLLYGHYDVQPAEATDGWLSPPFEPVIREGRMYGRGSSDNKGQHLAQLWAIRAFLAARGELPVNVKVLIEGEEEVGSPHLAELVRAHRELLHADVAITSDGPVHRSGTPQLVLGTRGQLGIELRARGANQDAHSGSLGGLLPDPAADLVRALSSLWDRSGRVAVAGFYDAVRPPTEAERENLARLPLNLRDHLDAYGIAELPPPLGPNYYERLMLQPTLTITGLTSGYTGPGMKTVIASEAAARIDMRLVPDQDPDELFALLREHFARNGRSVETVRLSSVPPSRTSADDPVIPLIAGAVSQAVGQEPFVVPSLGGSLPNFAFTDILAIPSVLVPYANPDQSNHAENENFELRRFRDGMRICATLMDHLAG
ncbi:M20/M25/M40 family metallo-hydrolase [Leifsonia bigeumensis]|uniref:M20/M25/M40 family metallo-hydrolase n=1 Tax=Leifsonella bigeumensis TaxID=433643 RepID=A0ABP7FUW2_9MICO